MSRPRIYHGPDSPMLLDMLFHLSKIVEFVMDSDLIDDDVWVEFSRAQGIDIEAVRDAVLIELADHGFYG